MPVGFVCLFLICPLAKAMAITEDLRMPSKSLLHLSLGDPKLAISGANY